jgi:hypothetical protein
LKVYKRRSFSSHHETSRRAFSFLTMGSQLGFVMTFEIHRGAIQTHLRDAVNGCNAPFATPNLTNRSNRENGQWIFDVRLDMIPEA